MAVLATSALAGCMGGGNRAAEEPSYQGEYKEFDLFLFGLTKYSTSADNRWELYPGAKVDVWAFAPENDPSLATIPGPEIRVREGDTVQINLYLGGSPMAHTLHWHGLHVPWDQDGVPYLSQAPLGERMWGGNGTKTYTYTFTVTGQSGTYWYHCHVDTQHHLDMGMYGAFIVEPADPDQDPPYDQEQTLFLDEWDKSHIHGNLQPDQFFSRNGDPEDQVDAIYGQVRDYYHMGPLTGTLNTVDRTYQDAIQNPALPQEVRDTLNDTKPFLLRENRTWYPFTYPAYYAEYDTFLINGHAYPSTEVLFVNQSETLRLRLVNAGGQVHSMHLHGHHFLVTHKDGYLLDSPYYADTLLIGPGERYDLYVEMNNPGPWMFHDHIPQNEQNDNINPGGMMTHICYRDGWALASLCSEGHDGHHAMTSEDLVAGMTKFLQQTQGAVVDPNYAGVASHNH